MYGKNSFFFLSLLESLKKREKLRTPARLLSCTRQQTIFCRFFRTLPPHHPINPQHSRDGEGITTLCGLCLPPVTVLLRVPTNPGLYWIPLSNRVFCACEEKPEQHKLCSCYCQMQGMPGTLKVIQMAQTGAVPKVEEALLLDMPHTHGRVTKETTENSGVSEKGHRILR